MKEDCCTYSCNQGRDCPVRRRHIKPYPHTPEDTLTPTGKVDFLPDRKDALLAIGKYALFLACLLCIVFTLSVIAGFASA